MLTCLHHIQIAIPADGEAIARAFYGDLLGFPEVLKPPQLAGRGGVWFEQDGLRVHLGVDPEFIAARKAHPAFLVSDLASLIATFEKNDVALMYDEPVDGFERVFVSDPFGNRIELMQPTE